MSWLKENLNISNSLSFLRVLLTIPMAYFLLNDMNYYVLGIGILAWLTDIGDGYFARKFNEVTNLGRVLDPIADKIFIGAAAIIMLYAGKIPVWFFIVIVGRDLLILTAGLYASRKTDVVLQSNYFGKVTVMIIGVAIAFLIFDIKELTTPAMVLSCAGIAATLISYTVNLFRLLRKNPQNE